MNQSATLYIPQDESRGLIDKLFFPQSKPQRKSVNFTEFLSLFVNTEDSSSLLTMMRRLRPYLNEVRSFSTMEEDEYMDAVDNRAIMNTIAILKRFLAVADITPEGLVPTRSGGVALDYQVKAGHSAYYRVDKDGSITITAIHGKKSTGLGSVTSIQDLPLPAEVIR